MKNNMSVFNIHYYERNPFKHITNFFRKCKWMWQRATRGYADCDLWNMDSWFLSVMPAMLDHLANIIHSYPLLVPETAEEVREKYKDREDEINDPIDSDETSEAQYHEWQKILHEIARLFRESHESTCSKVNSFEEKYNKMYEEFDQQYGVFGAKLELKTSKTSSTRIHFPKEIKPEWNDVTENYLKEENQIAEYRRQCFKEGIDQFKKWFWDLWD